MIYYWSMFFVSSSTVPWRALHSELEPGQLMTSDQEGKTIVEPQVQQSQEAKEKKIPLLVKYNLLLLVSLLNCVK